MNNDIIKAAMNPTRQRIAQFIAIHGASTPGEIASVLSDVPRASLYRHIKILSDAGLIAVTDEKMIRGTLEKRYGIASGTGGKQSNDEISAAIQSSLAMLMTSFSVYFSEKDSDPVKDLLCVSGATIMQNDEEFTEFLQKYAALIRENLEKPSTDGRKPRCITFISSPSEKD